MIKNRDFHHHIPLNRVVEKKHQDVIETTRCFLSNSMVPTKYWVEAAQTAIYSINRLSSIITIKVSPFDHTSAFCCFLGYSPSHKAYRCL